MRRLAYVGSATTVVCERTLEPWVLSLSLARPGRNFAHTKLANALISKFRLSSNEGHVSIFHELLSAVRRFKPLFPNRAMQPRTFEKAFRASMGQRRFRLLFIYHCAPRTFSIKRRFQSAAVLLSFFFGGDVSRCSAWPCRKMVTRVTIAHIAQLLGLPLSRHLASRQQAASVNHVRRLAQYARLRRHPHLLVRRVRR